VASTSVGVLFARGVAGWFELECRVLDVEVARQAFLQRVEQLRRVAVDEAGVIDHDVCRQGRQVRGQRPDVEVVDVVHVVVFEEMGA
jgi:hypothetical protein